MIFEAVNLKVTRLVGLDGLFHTANDAAFGSGCHLNAWQSDAIGQSYIASYGTRRNATSLSGDGTNVVAFALGYTFDGVDVVVLHLSGLIDIGCLNVVGFQCIYLVGLHFIGAQDAVVVSNTTGNLPRQRYALLQGIGFGLGEFDIVVELVECQVASFLFHDADSLFVGREQRQFGISLFNQ